MAKQLINVGTGPNTKTGDNLRTAFIKINENFGEVYNLLDSGIAGEPGPQGPAGPQGPRGLRGDKGDTGAQGAIGPMGPAGTKGDKGDKGDTGDQGPMGAAGPQGLTGAKGDKGDVGDTGPQGIKGDKGDIGDPGAKGDQGSSAYQVAVDNGFVGTEEEWLDSLVGPPGQGGIVTSGSVFISNVTPTTTGNITDKIFSNNDRVLESFLTDTQFVDVEVLATSGTSNYLPTIIVNGIPVVLTEITFGSFSGTVSINLENSPTITALHIDGPTDICDVSYDPIPVITTAHFTGGYPLNQTEVKLGDYYDFTVTADLPFVQIEVSDYGAFQYQVFDLTETLTYTFIGLIADRGNTTTQLGAKIRVKKSTGSWSEYYYTEQDGAVDQVNQIYLNNIKPTITIGTITYPVSQGALKNSEQATIVNSVSNGDVVVYSSPNSELSVANNTSYETTKTVTRINGSYNVTNNNFMISATRTANGASSTMSTNVRIANVACTLAVTEPATRLRSTQDHTITITANQLLLTPPTLIEGAEGIFQGSAFAGSGTTWTRAIRITDDMIKGTYTWGSIFGVNLSGLTTNVITGNNTYTLGGFVSRNVTLPAYANEVSIPVEVTDYSKLTMTWNIKALPNKRAVGTTTIPDPNSWTIDALNTNPTTIRILDIAATLASSAPSTITIQESV